MSIFKRIFGKSNPKTGEGTSSERGKYMPEVKLPVDERFTINFKKNGGKFLYCDSDYELREAFANILDENYWHQEKVLCYDEELKDTFKDFQVDYTRNRSDAAFFLTTCEYLVGDNGAILISSNQIAEKKLHELPDNFVVYATTSQLVETIGEGLRGIKNKHKDCIPSNITTIKNFHIDEKEKDFLSYGSSTKNLYLLLLEDL